MRGLVIMVEPLKNILDGKKTWEIWVRATKIREQIALIQSKSGQIVGVCDLVGCEGPLTPAVMMENEQKHRIPKDSLSRNGIPYPKTHAWVLKNARRLTTPFPYVHPSGAVIWVTLDGTAAEKELKRVPGEEMKIWPHGAPR